MLKRMSVNDRGVSKNTSSNLYGTVLEKLLVVTKLPLYWTRFGTGYCIDRTVSHASIVL